MTGTRSVCEDAWGAAPEWDASVECDTCGRKLARGERFIEYSAYRMDHAMCGDCLENVRTAEELLDILGYDSVAALLAAMRRNPYNYAE